MYGDTISSMGSKSFRLPYILMEESKDLSVAQSLSFSVHISRQDAFIEVMGALARVVCRCVCVWCVYMYVCVHARARKCAFV